MANFELIIYSVPKEVRKKYGATSYNEFIELAEEHGDVMTLSRLIRTGKLLDNAEHRALLVNRDNPNEIVVADFNETIMNIRKITCVDLETTDTYCIYGKANKNEVQIQYNFESTCNLCYINNIRDEVNRNKMTEESLEKEFAKRLVRHKSVVITN